MFSESEISGNVPVANYSTNSSDSNNTSSNDTHIENSTQNKTTQFDSKPDSEKSGESGELGESNLSSAKTNTQTTDASKKQRPKRLIGSQRNPEAYRVKPTIKVVDSANTNSSNSQSQSPAQSLTSSQAPDNISSEENLAGENLSGENLSGETSSGENSSGENSSSENSSGENSSGENSSGENLAAAGSDFQQKQVQQVQSLSNNISDHVLQRANNVKSESDINQNKHDDDDDSMSTDYVDLDKKILNELMISNANRVAVPTLRNGKMSDDLEAEFNAVMGISGITDGTESINNLMKDMAELADKDVIEAGTKLKAKVLVIRGDSLFLDLNVREQGVILVNLFPADAVPKVGDEIEVTVGKFDIDDGLYEVTVPLAAADVRDWSQVHVGMIVDAKITKANSGGLECEVNRLRGFIPISQIDIFRVENLEQYVGQSMTCVVEEVDPERRNLVISRRAMINREREEQKKQLLTELTTGQVREGLVRKIIDGGVFVDLGGVDGFIPINKLSWGRVRHPSDIVSEGKRIVVRIDKIEEGTNRISLTYRDDSSNPWSNIFEHFQEKTQARGKVVKIMPFGAFVELMPGVDGLVLISELANKHVKNVHEIVKEGEWVDVFIVSIDTETRRIALSMRQLIPVESEIASDVMAEEKNNSKGDIDSGKSDVKSASNKKKQEGVAVPIKIKNVHKGQLKGGIGSTNENTNNRLKW
ncbi:MAG: S1 RNA-binding domain-containing protein [Planctomycetaceae bacterium]|jgi:small subunit ribosomal protein S1|nr:S1 RNA-binding domain-containing protein [Planctomycetaceae bacterium]